MCRGATYHLNTCRLDGEFASTHSNRTLREQRGRLGCLCLRCRLALWQGKAVGFWSYVQEDDIGDQGRILALADDLRGQYRLLTGEPLHLFIDRESIDWGEAWKERIDTAIAGTTFFIPILTPSYFRSPECRRELLKFAREAERLGLTELLMSIYWVQVPQLEDAPEASQDEAIRLVAKYNWEPLRDQRLEDRDSSIYRKAVSRLAERLADRAHQAQQVNDIPATSEPPPVVLEGGEGLPEGSAEEIEPGVIDRLAATEEAMPKAAELLRKLGQHLEEVNEQAERAGRDLQGAAARGQGVRAALTVTDRLAHELSPPAAAIAGIGHEYGQVLAEVDSGMHAKLDLIEEADARRAVDDDRFLGEILDMVNAAKQAEAGLTDLLESAEPISKLSRSLRAPLVDLKDGLLGVLDGNALIEEWGRRARQALDGDADGEASS